MTQETDKASTTQNQTEGGVSDSKQIQDDTLNESEPTQPDQSNDVVDVPAKDQQDQTEVQAEDDSTPSPAKKKSLFSKNNFTKIAGNFSKEKVANKAKTTVDKIDEIEKQDESDAPQEKKVLFKSTFAKVAVSLGFVLIVGSLGLYSYLSNDKADKNKVDKNTQSSEQNAKPEIVYKTALDSTSFSEIELFDISYPFGQQKIQNTKQYSRSLFEKINSIVVDPTGQPLPNTSMALETMPNINYGYATLKIELNALPRQPFFVRLVSEKDGEPYAVRHFYLKADESRTIDFEGLSGGRYYLQALNLITQAPYVSTTFNLTPNGLITGNAIINFIKIKEIDHVFQLPLEDEGAVLLVEDIPIVLNADINREVLDFSKSRAIKEAMEEDY